MSHSGFSFAAAWAGSPASARWMALAQARAGTCHFLDYGSRCRGARCAGVGYDFARVDDTDDVSCLEQECPSAAGVPACSRLSLCMSSVQARSIRVHHKDRCSECGSSSPLHGSGL